MPVYPGAPDLPHQELPSDEPPRYIAIMISKQFFEKHYRFYSRKKPGVFRGIFLDPGEGFVPLLKRFMIEADSKTAGGTAVIDALERILDDLATS